MFRVWAVSMRSTHPLKMTRNYCRSIKNSEDFVKSKSPNPKTLYSSTHIFWIVYWLFICSLPNWWQCVFFLIHNSNSWIMIFFDRDSDKKIEITKKLVHLHIKLGEVVEVRILCEFFSLQIILYSWLWNLSLSKYLFSPLQGVDLYIKLLSEVSDDSIKCSLQTELLSLLSRLPSLTQDQEQLVSNISCWTALILFL